MLSLSMISPRRYEIAASLHLVLCWSLLCLIRCYDRSTLVQEVVLNEGKSRLKLLLRQRHWQTYGTFCRQYDRAARELDRDLVGTYPSKAQFYRWIAGQVKSLPYPHHCLVLEALLPGWTAEQLFEPGRISDTMPVLPGRVRREETPIEIPEVFTGNRFADVEAIFATRSEFTSTIPVHSLFDHARELQIAGLSLNLLCQQYANESLRRLISAGTTVTCLFLDPAGEAVRAREQEEGHEPGHLSVLTKMNMQMLTQRVRARLPEADRERLIIGTYDQTIRFNIITVDQTVSVVQPYLHGIRGVEAPTMVLRRDSSPGGLFPVFQNMFAWLFERSTLI